MKFQKLIFSISIFLCSVAASAQPAQVSGKVSDAGGEPLAGVVVNYPGSNKVAMTDAEGNFKIDRVKGGTLEFSCLGMLTESVKVSDQKSINVTMRVDAVALEGAEVVSIGYGSVAKRDLTGSVASVNMKELMKAPVVNFDQALAGRVAGVVVTTGDGAVGAEAKITIRGNNSLTQSSEPLYVIDGFPSESSMATSLNPADIESIDVLKDASATAIYGARGANGVIVITTKGGWESKPKVNFVASLTSNAMYNKIEIMDSYDFVRLQEDFHDTMGTTNIYLRGYDELGVLRDYFYSIEDYRDAPTVDWQDKIYRKSLTQNYSVSLSGGNKASGTRYNLSFGALDQQGIIVQSSFQRYQGKINLTQKIGKSVTADLRMSYSRAITNGVTPTDAQAASSASGWLIYSVWGYRPVKPIYQGEIDDDFLNSIIDADIASANDYRFNPALTVRNEYRKRIQDFFNGNAALSWDIVDGLTLRVSGSYTMNKTTRENFDGSQTYSGYEGSPSGAGVNGSIYWYDTASWVNDNTLTYKKVINRNHHVQALAGFSMQGQKTSSQGVRATQMTTEALGLMGLNTGTYQNVKPSQANWMMLSGLARLIYSYKYKYYLTASLRADGSSKFPEANRWGVFPSASAAWTFCREPWLKNLTWLSNGKFRASWGLTGNNRTTTPYDFYSQITTSPGTAASYDYVFNGKIIPGYYPSNMANDKLKWETTEQIDLGIDLAFLDNRIKLVSDVYLKNTRDLLLAATLPSSSGYTSAMINVGSMRNKGLEITLDLVPVRTRDLQWTTSFNIAFNRNIVTALSNNQYSLISTVGWDSNFSTQYPYITQVGKPSGMMYGYIYKGTYKSDEFVSGVTLKEGIPYLESLGREKMQPGDPKYADINGDGVINDDDRTIIGCGQPVNTGGWGNTLNWKGFDLNMFLQWSKGNDILNANRLIFENAYSSYLNQFKTMTEAWHATRHPDSDIPRIHANGMYNYSSRVVEDGSFLRIKNISLGYTLPSKALFKMKVESMRVYVSADNIHTFTNYSGPDPEVSTRNSVLTPGFDWSAYPRAFGLTAGVSLTF